MIFWPSYRKSVLAGSHALTQPFLRLFDDSPANQNVSSPKAIKSKSKESLAQQTRSMEFRVHNFHVDLATVHFWQNEWDSTPSHQIILLRMLLKQLPEVGSKETLASHRKGLLETIFELSSEGKKAQPENGFFLIAESLAHFYSGEDERAISTLKQAGQYSQLDFGLKELNRSEYFLWQKNQYPWILLPQTPRYWGVELERPFHAFSRSLALQERTLLQRYNMERAMELAILHLRLAIQIMESSWTPSDLAIARSMVNRALEPFWSRHEMEPAADQLETNFTNLLEDQGDKLALAKVQAWLSDLHRREHQTSSWLTLWRKLQLLAAWNASTVLANLMFQMISLLLVWFTVAFFSYSFPSNTSPQFPFMIHIAFSIAPLCWTISAWQAGGTYLVLGLIGGWLLWGWLLKIYHYEFSMVHLRSALAKTLIAAVTTTLFITFSVAWLIQYRQQHLALITERGWLN